MYKTYDNYPDVLNVTDVQEILGIGRKQAYELVNSGVFHVTKIGKRIKISKKILIDWLEGGKNYEKAN
ncbi:MULTISPECIES: helix-turn-helix domain-containing protein [Bacillaceae]|uniref:helix-turn-helix domain-containing protein n=1 Tax=Bacillaceae TaxID=186817 RepID=UPI0011A786B7|nr:MULTISPECIES: helix-turn-helix domain-containing protein [Bacillaceae]KAF2425601.1 DNA-binding protein [Bacillus subtilis]